MKKRIATILFLGLIVFSASAQWTSGNDLHKQWIEYRKLDMGLTHDSKMSLLYMGYISACMDSLEMLYLVTNKPDRPTKQFPIPPNATLGQICSIVGKYLDNHPENWSESGYMVFMAAIMEAFPLPQ